MDFLGWIETSALSEWVRGSDCICAFPTIITLHTIAMGFLAGGSAAIDLRILGIARYMPLARTAGFLPVLWLAFAVNATSGTLLLIAYPTKALTNPVFYVKVVLIGVAVSLVFLIGRAIMQRPEADEVPLATRLKVLAFASLASWVALITAGRLLAYTHRWEMIGVPSIL